MSFLHPQYFFFFPSPQLNQLEKAVEAGHTFFMANPEHMEMQQNIENYRTMAGVEESHLVDREARQHLVSSGDPCQPGGAKCSLVSFASRQIPVNGYPKMVPDFQNRDIFILLELLHKML